MVMSPGGQSNLLLIRRLLHPSKPDFDSIWARFIAQVLPKFFIVRNDAYEQLAMYYEHKAHDPEQARQIVRQALDELRRASQVGDIAPGPHREIKARFDHRMTPGTQK